MDSEPFIDIEAIPAEAQPPTDNPDGNDSSGAQEPAQAGSSESAEHEEYFALVVRDGIDLPIEGLEITATLSNGYTCTAFTSRQGAIAVPVNPEQQGKVKVEVTDARGRLQEVCTLDATRCKGVVVVRSPKVQVKLPLRVHQQRPPRMQPAPAKPAAAMPPASAANAPTPNAGGPWWQANGALGHAWSWLMQELGIAGRPPAQAPAGPVVERALSVSGQPVTIVAGPECPNKDGLKLGRNNVYRAAIVEASKRLGLIPQAICALIDCEAAKVREQIALLNGQGKPLLDKKGKPQFKELREMWDAHSGNAQSNAAGLTQFLRGTWLDHVLRSGFYIHEQSKARGWVKLEAEPAGRLRRAVQALPGVKPKMRWVFVLADGTTTPTPGRELGDATVRQCLDMRLDPAWSINAAADYGAANLKVLERAGFKLAGLNDMDKAKLMYLMHHEGEGAGPAFIRDSLGKLRGGTDGLRRKFAMQFGKDGAAATAKLIAAAGGDIELAYRAWFAEYVDGKFGQSGSFFCSSPPVQKKLSVLMKAVGGQGVNEM